MSKAVFVKLSVREIRVPRGRARRGGDISGLQRSIEELGLLNPITVTAEGHTLVCGLRRLSAVKALRWTHVDVHLVTLEQLDMELAELDENEMRLEPSALERAESAKRRKEIYEAKHPETRRGVAGGKAGGRGRKAIANETNSFAIAEAARRNVSKRTVEQDVQIATNLGDKIREAIRGSALESSKNDLLALAKIEDESEQLEIVEAVKSGRAKNVRKAQHRRRVEQQHAAARAAAPQGALIEHRAAQDFLRSLAPRSVDLLLTDPPYMTDVEDVTAFASEWVPLALSRVKPTGRAFICTGAYPVELHAYLGVLLAAKDFTVGNVLVWTYENTIGPGRELDYKNNWQAIFHVRGHEAPPLDCPVKLELFTVQHINAPDGRQGDRYHAWQKPDELGDRIVRHSTKPGEAVIDPFAGTGSFLLAAAKLGRRARGCEISEENLAIAIGRGCQRAG